MSKSIKFVSRLDARMSSVEERLELLDKKMDRNFDRVMEMMKKGETRPPVEFIDVPIFTGFDDDLRPWINWMENYFAQYDDFTELQKLAMSHGFIEGPALACFFERQSWFPFRDWEDLKREFLMQFGNKNDPEKLRIEMETRRFLKEFNKRHEDKSETDPFPVIASASKQSLEEKKAMEEEVIDSLSVHEDESESRKSIIHHQLPNSDLESCHEDTLLENVRKILVIEDQQHAVQNIVSPICDDLHSTCGIDGLFDHQEILQVYTVKERDPLSQKSTSEKVHHLAHKLFEKMCTRRDKQHTKQKKIPKSWKFRYKYKAKQRDVIKRMKYELTTIGKLMYGKQRYFKLYRAWYKGSRTKLQVLTRSDNKSEQMHFPQDIQPAPSTLWFIFTMSTATMMMDNLTKKFGIQKVGHCVDHEINRTASQVWHRWKNKTVILMAVSRLRLWGLVRLPSSLGSGFLGLVSWTICGQFPEMNLTVVNKFIPSCLNQCGAFLVSLESYMTRLLVPLLLQLFICGNMKGHLQHKWGFMLLNSELIFCVAIVVLFPGSTFTWYCLEERWLFQLLYAYLTWLLRDMKGALNQWLLPHVKDSCESAVMKLASVNLIVQSHFLFVALKHCCGTIAESLHISFKYNSKLVYIWAARGRKTPWTQFQYLVQRRLFLLRLRVCTSNWFESYYNTDGGLAASFGGQDLASPENFVFGHRLSILVRSFQLEDKLS